MKFRDMVIHTCDKVPKDKPCLVPMSVELCPFCGEKLMDEKDYKDLIQGVNPYGTEEMGDGKGRTRSGEPTFYKLLEEMAELHERKSHDYAHDADPMGNYHFAGLVANLFGHSPHDAGFAGRLAEKIYRISVLEGGRKIPKNESVDDTERDIAVIAVLWMADRRKRRMTSPTPENKLMSPIEQASQDAACKIIEVAEFLTVSDKKQMIDYLRACLRDEDKPTSS